MTEDEHLSRSGEEIRRMGDDAAAVGLDQPVSRVLSVGVVVEGTQVLEGGAVAELVLVLCPETNKGIH